MIVDQYTLNQSVEFDVPFLVHADGTISRSDERAYLEVNDDTLGQSVGGAWCLLRNWTGQHGYNGPTMHPSEYLGGALARHVLETPGTYVLLISYAFDDEDPDDDGMAGWCIAYHE